MTDENDDQVETPAMGVGAQLRAAREEKGLSTQDVSARTRIAERHIQSIESGRFDDLPGRIYAIGFAKNIAKVVGLNQGHIADLVRAEMGEEHEDDDHRVRFEPGDPARAPGRGLIWFSLFALIVLLAGLFVTARELFAPAARLPSLLDEDAAQEASAETDAPTEQAEQAPQGAPTGPVVFTAQGPAWVRFTDGQGRILMEREMSEGETYTLPADADGPQLTTARPDILDITIGGQSVPRLAEELRTLVDVPVGAAALLERGETDMDGSDTGSAPAQ